MKNTLITPDIHTAMSIAKRFAETQMYAKLAMTAIGNLRLHGATNFISNEDDLKLKEIGGILNDISIASSEYEGIKYANNFLNTHPELTKQL